MKLSPKQFDIVNYLIINGTKSKKELMDALQVIGWYYCNESKYFGQVLSRLVKSGHIKREKKGLYSINDNRKIKRDIPENQIDLFV